MMRLESTAFQENEPIPDKYTCQGGQDGMISPPLAWSAVPAEAKTLMLIVEDADAVEAVERDGVVVSWVAHRNRPWVHWVLYNIPPSAGGLREGASREEGTARDLPGGTWDGVTHRTDEGVNGEGKNAYRAPCPPDGRPHNYLFHLYALDLTFAGLGGLNDNKGPSKADLFAYLTRSKRGQPPYSRIIAQTRLRGTYGIPLPGG